MDITADLSGEQHYLGGAGENEKASY